MTRALPARQAEHLRVNPARLLATVDELAAIGGLPGGGVHRLAFSPEEDRARAYLRRRAAGAGLAARIDQAGNVIISRSGRRPGTPVLMMGSHMDTVANGGRLDGAYGVLAALEVMTVFADLDVPPALEPVAVAFTNEEGGLFPYPFFGSQAIAGTLDPYATYTTRTGVDLRGPLRRAGGDPDRLASAAWPAGSIGAYLELHIEQGPILEARGLPIGVVEGITGRTIFEISLVGRSNHAGTTPMDRRADALVAASRVVLAVQRLATRGLCSVATVGQVESWPDQVNVIPGRVNLVGELRDLSSARIGAAENTLSDDAAAIAEECMVDIGIEFTGRIAPVATAPALSDTIREEAERLGLASMPIGSGAGHDAQIIARIAPVGMLFVPSRGGVSHDPAEDTDDAQLTTGAEVLLRTALALSCAPGDE
jgi:beta-ureidopropionase / N-carbamoyl-L-amino-acid hydrolase